MFSQRPAWTPATAMSPCHAIVTAWTCITAATILLGRAGWSARCRATGPRTWPRITNSAIRPKLRRAARHHLPRARRRDRAREGARHVRRSAPVRKRRAWYRRNAAERAGFELRDLIVQGFFPASSIEPQYCSENTGIAARLEHYCRCDSAPVGPLIACPAGAFDRGASVVAAMMLL